MSEFIAPPFFVASALLALAGASKLRHPEPTSLTLSATSLPGRRGLVRALGAWEVAVGTAALAAPRPAVALAVAATYLAFAGFLAHVIRAGVPVPNCGCAGSEEAHPGWLHVALDLVAVLAAVAVALSNLPPVWAFSAVQPLLGAPFLAGAAALGLAAYLAAVRLPGVQALVRSSSRLGHHHHGATSAAPAPSTAGRMG